MSFKDVQKEIKPGEACLITDPSNIRYLSGFTGSNGQIIITSKKCFLLTDFRYFGLAEKVLPKGIALSKALKSPFENIRKIIAGQKIKTLYFEANSTSYSKYLLLKKELVKINLQPREKFIEIFRIVKTPAELAKITKAQRIAEKILTETVKNLKTGKSENEVSWEIIRLAHQYGADDVSFPPIVAFGNDSGTPHHLSGSRRLKKGDIVLLDLGMKYKGYCSDMTRTFFTAPPTRQQKTVYLTVLEAQETAINTIKAGITGLAADETARKIITKAGFGKNFGHSLGHGVGLQIHELPSLSNHYGEAIPENAVVTVEPGIYLQNSFGVRIEDMVLVTRKKALNLTKIPKKIEDCILKIK
jgi:Xaa-Pro aminopeptidase